MIPLTRIYRQQIIEGVTIPAFIHNGEYFFVDLDFYEDGRVECWKFEDFDSFIRSIKEQWVHPSIPDFGSFFIHGLGSWYIKKGEWRFDAKSFIKYCISLLKHLNPEMLNIHHYVEKRYKEIIVGENGDGLIYKKENENPFSTRLLGDSMDIFYNYKERFFLSKLIVFQDGSVEIHRIPEWIYLKLEDINKLIQEGLIRSEIPEESIVEIYGLGKFKIDRVRHKPTNIEAKFLELFDIYNRLNNKPDSIQICQSVFNQYLANPTELLRKKLKEAYELIPEHLRSYVGDMDIKDTAVRMIIYGDNEIENWTHYKLAKMRGEPLPKITVPRPTGE